MEEGDSALDTAPLFSNDDAKPQEKHTKRSRRQTGPSTKRVILWDDDSVATMFRLRYKSHLARRFESKINAEKKAAWVMLAAELSVTMERDYNVAQVQDKFSKLKAAWALSKPSIPGPTGNEDSMPMPQDYDVMLEYWGDKLGFQRDSLMSTDAITSESVEFPHDEDESFAWEH
ncbi:hypothetical protein Ae201684P_012628 [Aphanomyces euteiches]|uniref:Myb/SANT-like domain-containing protein n=1 Tax=Aphanomyces euteiches TaxID=100861 RepID=A0A6G0WBA8_9STRA|nr:hypothetical protein Ae201684_016822 [Aphanomyces euteiches]KAH9076140.1 hypothetical protein Ae201684P_012628 [Aphanomyces euteiches]